MELTLENFLNKDGLNSQEFENLILFDYSREIQFSRNWDSISLEARGITFDKISGQIVNRPFKKFFNFSEIEFQEMFKGVPKDEPFLVTKKEDGSLGIISIHNGKLVCITRGSFKSDQCIWAKQWLEKNVDISLLNPDFTYLFEIIYKENRIVIDYEGFEGLILLSLRNKVTGQEMSYNEVVEVGKSLGVKVVHAYSFNSLEELFSAREKLGNNEEGFCVFYPRLGIRFKLKGDEYIKIHGLISNLTALAFWRSIDLNTLEIPTDYLKMLPEEFRDTSDKLKKIIERMHKAKWYDIAAKGESCPWEFESDKQRWFYLEEKFGGEAGLVLGYLRGQHNKIKEKIHRNCRPTGNTVPGVDFSKVQRVLNEG